MILCDLVLPFAPMSLNHLMNKRGDKRKLYSEERDKFRDFLLLLKSQRRGLSPPHWFEQDRDRLADGGHRLVVVRICCGYPSKNGLEKRDVWNPNTKGLIDALCDRSFARTRGRSWRGSGILIDDSPKYLSGPAMLDVAVSEEPLTLVRIRDAADFHANDIDGEMRAVVESEAESLARGGVRL